MPVTAWHELTTWSTDSSNGGGFAWSNPGNAQTINDTFAKAPSTDISAQPSEYLKGLVVSGLDTTAMSSIDAVEVLLATESNDSGANPGLPDITRLSLVIAGSVQTENQESYVTPLYIDGQIEHNVFKFTSDIPTKAQAVASDYGIVLEVQTNPIGPASHSYDVDVILMRFVYTATSATSTTLDTLLQCDMGITVDNGSLNIEWTGSQKVLTNDARESGILYPTSLPVQTYWMDGGFVILQNIGLGDAYYGPSGNSGDWCYLKAGEVAAFRVVSGAGLMCYGNAPIRYMIYGDR